MKILIVSLVILALVLGGTALDTVLTARGVKVLQQIVESMPEKEEDKDFTGRQTAAKKLQSAWEEREFLFCISVPHDDVTNIEEFLSSLVGAADAKDDASFRVATENLRIAFSHLERLVVPNLPYII